jgi:hypothetical protein
MGAYAAHCIVRGGDASFGLQLAPGSACRRRIHAQRFCTSRALQLLYMYSQRFSNLYGPDADQRPHTSLSTPPVHSRLLRCTQPCFPACHQARKFVQNVSCTSHRLARRPAAAPVKHLHCAPAQLARGVAGLVVNLPPGLGGQAPPSLNRFSLQAAAPPARVRTAPCPSACCCWRLSQNSAKTSLLQLS